LRPPFDFLPTPLKTAQPKPTHPAGSRKPDLDLC
jgi:hypothetical protein